MKPQTLDAYHAAQADTDRAICDRLRQLIDQTLPGATSKMWHAHPVWFLDGNPVVGYSKLKSCVRLFFWSGQSFDTSGLTPSGTFKAAEKRYTDPAQIDTERVQRWIAESETTQWDYRNIVKNKGRLGRLC